MILTKRFSMFLTILLLSAASRGETVRIRMIESSPVLQAADGTSLKCREGSVVPVGSVLQTQAEGRACLEWRWDGVQPGQTDVMLLGFNTTIKRLEDQEGQCVFELQEGLVRLTQRHPERNSEDVLVFQGSPLACRAADVIVESLPRKGDSALSGGTIMSNGNQGKVVWRYGKRRVGFSGPGMRVIRPEGRVGGVVPLTNMAWTDALGRTNVIGFNMSEADETVTFQGKDDGPVAPATPEVDESEKASTTPVLVRFETNLGAFVVKVDPENYPITCRNFLAYVDAGFYEDTLFHRVISGFMVQGGGFDTEMRRKETRGPIQNESGLGPIRNTRGTIAMARTSAPDSATSQFYINHKDNAFLDDGPYCAFGRVVEGMSTIDAIAKERTTVRRGMRDVPEEQVIIRSAKRVEDSP
ncbi:MAG: peptidylprolyl isomerase [Planctomycetota bacterium]|jgi:peptidyl-prolyl cis-trans isomerase A (cyclophilin A)